MASRNAMPYLFTATFNDGSTVTQNPEDLSPTTSGKNCYYDVLQRKDDVVSFGVTSTEDPTHNFFVDLRTGQFSANGVPFTVVGQNELPEGTTYRLVYFRQNTVELSADGVKHTVDVHIGWQATVDGKNHQQTVAVRN